MPSDDRRSALIGALRYFRDLGVEEVLRPGPGGSDDAGLAASAASPASARPVEETSSGPGRETAGGDAVPAAATASDLAAVRAAVAACQLCRLAQTRTQTVFSDGTGKTRIMFVGEAPGADEDATGVPFVGRAGQLLTKMIEGGMGLSRQDVYIANVLKCRPPGNRNPEPDEIALCRPYLEAQVGLVAPAALVALGKFAAQFLLETEEPISRLRGRWGSYRGIPVMPTYHPSFLLRQPERKKEAWEDLLKVLERLGLPSPRRPGGAT